MELSDRLITLKNVVLEQRNEQELILKNSSSLYKSFERGEKADNEMSLWYIFLFQIQDECSWQFISRN